MDLSNIRKILVLQQRQLGDVLLTTPALHLLKLRFPDAKIDFFTEEKCEPLLRFNPNIHKIISLNKKELKNIWQEYKFYKKVARNNYDLLINFQNLPRCFNISLLANAKIKIGPQGSFYRRLAYTHTYPIPAVYAAGAKISLLQDLDISYNQEKPELFLQDKERLEARQILANLGVQACHKLITLDTTHRRITRRYPPENFAKVVEQLCAYDKNFRFYLLRGPGEEQQIHELLASLPNSDAILLPKELANLRVSAAIIANAKMHLGNLSAPHHLAEAVGTPYFTIQGSTGNEWVYPSPKHYCLAANLECQPCYSNKCEHIDCLKKLDPKFVAAKFIEHFNSVYSK